METQTAKPEAKKQAHHRSPSYPVLNLERALDKARAIYNADKRSFTSRAVILQHLGYKDEKSGVGNRELAALRQYGLLEEKSGQYRVSDLAYAILFLSEGSEDRRSKMTQAALSPSIFKELWGKYGAEASDPTLKDFLIHSRNFNPSFVDDVISTYRSTISFAKPTGVAYTGDQEESEEEMPETPAQPDPPKDPLMKPKLPPQAFQISTPVGSEEGQVIFAHVRFDGALKKDFVTSLKKYLDYLETTLQ